jgi:hypothetical protein
MMMMVVVVVLVVAVMKGIIKKMAMRKRRRKLKIMKMMTVRMMGTLKMTTLKMTLTMMCVDDDDDDSRLHSENEYAQDDDYEVYLGPNNEDWCYDPDSDDYFNALKGLKIETSQKQSHSVAEVLGLVKELKHDIKALLGCRDMPESYYRTLVRDLIPFFDDGMHYPINNRLSHIT